MSNNHFIARQFSDEIWDTLFFSGCKFNREKKFVNGNKVYEFSTPDFVVTIEGNKIKINGNKVKSLRDAKQCIVTLADT